LPDHVAAIVLAAGVGRRMEAGQPKQFLLLNDRPLFTYALEFFLGMAQVHQICLVLNAEAMAGDAPMLARDLAADYSKPLSIVEGGARRQDSVLAGLKALPSDTEIVLVHDSARPFPPYDAVLQSIEEAQANGGAILASPVHDTVKMANGDGRIQQTLNRELLWLAQTPQTFRYPDLLEAMQTIDREGLDITDEAMAFERLGREVHIVRSTPENLKVTIPEDLPRAEAIIRRRNQENLP